MAESVPVKVKLKQRNGSTASPATSPAPDATQRRLSRLEDRLAELLAERDRGLPLWVRPPKTNKEKGKPSPPEHYSSISRSKLYALAASGDIRSVSLRERGQIKATRLFYLPSILAYIEKAEADADAAKGGNS